MHSKLIVIEKVLHILNTCHFETQIRVLVLVRPKNLHHPICKELLRIWIILKDITVCQFQKQLDGPPLHYQVATRNK